MNNELDGLFASTRMKKTVALVLILFALFLITKIMSELKEYRFIGGSVPITNTVTLSGTGEVFAVPDIATFSFSIIEEKPSAKAAQDIATERINSIIDYLRDSDIKEKDIKTTSYNVFPRYEYQREICNEFRCPPGERVLKGFEVSQTIRVKVTDTDRAGEILAGIGERGVTNVSGLNFTIDDEEDLNREARKKAILDAEKKAKELAKDLGVRLVRVVNFSESGGQPPIFRSFGFAETALFDQAAAPAPEIPVGENKITSQVTITYEIR